MNKYLCIGNLTRDPELRYLQNANNTVLTKFSIAINDGYGDKQQTSFLNCTAFGKIAEVIANYTTKGSKVAIEGKIQTGNYTNKEGLKIYTTDVIVEKIEFLSKSNQQGDIPEGFLPSSNEDIPF